MYDYIIIGTGPTGLTLAYYLAKLNYKILLLDKNSSPGGCHRVHRVHGYFAEHGPRIYINNYFSLINLLNDMGIKFDDLFTKYDFGINISIQQVISSLSLKEIMAIVYEFLKFTINSNATRHISLMDFMTEYNFSETSKKTIDRICRLTDGGNIENYTLFEFFQVFNQNFFYQTYQPKYPNDIGLIKIWMDHIIATNNVTIHYNINITEIIEKEYISITDGNNIFIGEKYIFAIPPKPFVSILENSINNNMFGNITTLKSWSNKSSYIDYIPIIFHWKEKLILPKV